MSDWLKSNWGPLVCVILAVSLGLSALALSTKEIRQEAAEQQQQAEAENESANALTVTMGEPGTYQLQYNAKREERAEGGPLGLSPDWWIAIFTAVLTSATIWLAVGTRKLWQATNETLGHSRETSERELRAYLSVTRADFVPRPLVAGQKIKAKLSVMNTGRTPAKNFRIRVDTDVFPFPLDRTLDCEIGHSASKQELGAGREVEIEDEMKRPLTDVEVAGIAAGTMVLMFWGRVEFEDVFGVHRWMTIRSAHGGRYSKKPGVFAVTEDGNDSN